MQINYEVNENNINQVSKKFKLLGNPKYLKILLILQNNSKTLDEIHKTIEKEDYYLHRESTYKVIEKMVLVGLIKKEYIQKEKKFFYSTY